MTEKRFKYKITDGFFDGDVLISIKEVVDLLNEQQATIRRLQDLCGESDSENAKLRLENKRLQKELNDCEKFRYTVFKRMEELQAQLREKEEDERLYANEIVELRKTNEEWLQFKELGGDY